MEQTVVSQAVAPAETDRRGGARPDKASAGRANAAPTGADEADVFDFDDDFDDDVEDEALEDDADDSSPSDSDEIKAIDATLARFSAVHDQIAVEEAERRKKFSWLRSSHKEPELGRDMPFDFAEGRDAQSSRVEWKQQQRKRRTTRIVQVLAVAAAVTLVVVTGIGLSA